MTRAGGVSNYSQRTNRKREGAKNRRGELDWFGLGAEIESTPQRDGPKAGRLRTVRRGRQTSKGTK